MKKITIMALALSTSLFAFSNWVDNDIQKEHERLMKYFHKNYTIPDYDSLKSVKTQQNTYVKNGNYYVEIALPGVKKENIDVKIDEQKRIVTVQTENKNKNEEKKKDYHKKEFSYSSYKQSFYIPKNVDESTLKVSYENGMLSIKAKVKKQEKESKIRKLQIN